MAPTLRALEGATGLRRLFDGAYKRALYDSASLFASPTGTDAAIAALRDILASREAEAQLAATEPALRPLFGARWRGVETDSETFAAGEWVADLHLAVGEGRMPAPALAFLSRRPDAASLAQKSLSQRAEEASTLASQAREALGGLANRLVALGVPAPPPSALYRAALAVARESHETVAPSVGVGRPVPAALALLSEIAEIRARRDAVVAGDGLARAWFGVRWSGLDSEPGELAGLVAWTRGLHASITRGELPSGIVDFFAENRPRVGLDAAVIQAQEDRRAAAEAVARVLADARIEGDPHAFADSPIAEQRARLALWRENLPRLRGLIGFNALADEARGLGMDSVAALAAEWPDAPFRLAEAFERSWLDGVLRRGYEAHPALNVFDRTRHEETIAEFRRLDKLLLTYNRTKVALAHWRRVPRESATGTLGWLQTQMGLRRRHAPIRRAMASAWEPIQAIKPVFLMSPLSVATYLPPAGPRFDLVIFDEASQIRPEDAFGALLRGDQTIVVGDAKQMPPTSFFDKLASGEDADEEADDDAGTVTYMRELESILALMSAKLPQHSPRRRGLRWHYRSRHDSLIAVSNRMFYEDRLVVFPSPQRFGPGAGLVLRHDASTVYDRGGKRHNLGEAQAIARAALAHVREAPRDSLGIAAFSMAQRTAIEDALAALGAEAEIAEFNSLHPNERLFVKNLENVQGDERDVVLISIGYGRDANGFVTQSFGPLNRDGGERRMNVLITRARKRCEVFTNLRGGDVRIEETTPSGVRALRRFLEYAETRRLDAGEESGRPPGSPFEEDVIARLRGAGHSVEPQVGSCGFFLDIGVRHPREPGRFVLGVECDGAMYHSARSARDRDRLRQSVLEGIGWRIHRIWSTDWFTRPDAEFVRLEEAIREATAAYDAGETERRDEALETVARPVGDPFEREAPTEEEVRVQIPTATNLYRLSGFIPEGGGQLHELPAGLMAAHVLAVVRDETPVHRDEVLRRIREAYFVGRTGGRILAAFKAGLGRAVATGSVELEGGFLRLPGASPAAPRSRAGLPAASRRLDLVAPEEIDLALVGSVVGAFGATRAEASASAIRVLGFERATAGMVSLLDARLNALLTEGGLVEEAGVLRAAAS